MLGRLLQETAKLGGKKRKRMGPRTQKGPGGPKPDGFYERVKNVELIKTDV